MYDARDSGRAEEQRAKIGMVPKNAMLTNRFRHLLGRLREFAERQSL